MLLLLLILVIVIIIVKKNYIRIGRFLTEEEKIELPKKKEAAQELTIDDFIDDFKL